ncbi:MAG: GNAT family N-acetyltransferase [bacterium]
MSDSVTERTTDHTDSTGIASTRADRDRTADVRADEIRADEVRIGSYATEEDLPSQISIGRLATFLHEVMTPFEDSMDATERGITDALTKDGGFVVLARHEKELLGALVMVPTEMAGYVPENLLLFVGVSPKARNRGIGGRVCRHAIRECQGAVKLHVEPDNPAARLYERLGFRSKYLDMRLSP